MKKREIWNEMNRIPDSKEKNLFDYQEIRRNVEKPLK